MVGCPQGEIEDRNHRGCAIAVGIFPLPLYREGSPWHARDKTKFLEFPPEIPHLQLNEINERVIRIFSIKVSKLHVFKLLTLKD